MAECGIATAAHFHEVATGGQCEIDLMPQPLVGSADQVMLARYIIRNVARRNGKTATFMPKPLFGDNGSGMHTHFTLWKDGQPLLAGQGYAGLSDLGIYAIGGLLKHAPALCAFANPTTNSYKRLVAGLRGADQDLLQPPQPRRDHPGPAQQPQSPEPPHRVSRSRQRGQSLPALLGDAHGGPRRHPEQDPARRARSTRTSTTFSPRSSTTSRPPRARSKPRSTPCGPTTNSCSAATSSPPT